MKMLLKPEKIKLKNGASLIVQENHSTPQLVIFIYFKGGARYETAANSGITNFVQKLMLKGTKKSTAFEVAKRLEFIGAHLSFFAQKDFFGIKLKMLSKHLNEGLKILVEILQGPSFGETEVEKERKNILSEIKLWQDDSLIYAMELCEEALFSEHPYRLSLLGRKESLEKIDGKKILKWYNTIYNSSHMVISIAGDINPAKIVKLIKKMPPLAGDGSKEDVFNIQLSLDRKREIIVERDKKQVAMALGFLSPSIKSEDFIAFEVLNYILSGMGSRLFLEVRDRKGLAYVINSRYEPRLDAGIFRIHVGTSPSQKEKAQKTILAEIDKLKREMVGAEELERAKKHLLGIREIDMQKNSSIASRHAYYETMGLGWKMTYDFTEKIQNITAKDVKHVAEKYLDTKNYAVATLIPTAKK